MATDTDINEAAEDVVSKLSDDSDVDVETVKDHISTLTKYSIPIEDAKSDALGEFGDGSSSDPESAQVIAVGDVNTEDEYVTFEKVKVVETWEDGNFKQKGRFADEDDVIDYIIFNDSPLEKFDEGDVVRVEGAQTSEYNGNYSVKLFQSTNIEHIDGDIDTENAGMVQKTCPVVNIADDSGLIRRCAQSDDCSRVVRETCPKHGEGETELDIRIKGHFDDGDLSITFYINDNDTIEEVTGYSFEDFKQLFEDSDWRMSATLEPINEAMFLNYYEFRGRQGDDTTVFIDSIQEVNPDTKAVAENFKTQIPMNVGEDGGEMA